MMRPLWVPVAVILLICVSSILQASEAAEFYLEGEEDVSNEFLEVKEDDIWTQGHKRLKRLKRDFFERAFGSFFSTSTEAPEPEVATADPDVENVPDDDLEHGSGQPDRPEADLSEKTVKVSFVVMEPYQEEYNRRDSEQFQSFSSSLANEVNKLYEFLPGTQRASLVRIQSRVSDEFSCKVSLEIFSTGYDDTNRITQILRDHIRYNRRLGDVNVSDVDFSAYASDSSVAECREDEITCNDFTCVPGSARCDRINQCPDGVDEAGCNYDETNGELDQFQTDCERKLSCSSSSVMYCESQRCDNHNDCPEGDDELNCEGQMFDVNEITTETEQDTTPWPSIGITACPEGEFSCDETRCVRDEARCDNREDCTDGTDEANCGSKTCAADDFRCSNNMCISAANVCDRIRHCSDGEDEQNCECTYDEFQCVSDGKCIEMRKRCDNVSNCEDSSDEDNCSAPSCPSGSFTCDTGSSVQCATRCDQIPECNGGEDERDCGLGECSHICDDKCLDESKICDSVQDCKDGSDEKECDQCDGPNDLRCSNGECISISLRCNGIPECNDESDELNCNSTMVSKSECLPDEFRCRDGVCISDSFYCDGHEDCNDSSDEENCACGEQFYQCPDGQCIPKSAECDGQPDCSDGIDEASCNLATTPGSDLWPDYTTVKPQTQSPYGRVEPATEGYPYNRPGAGGTAGIPGYARPDGGSYGGDVSTSRYPSYNRPGGDNNGGTAGIPGYGRPDGGSYGGDESNSRYPNYNRPGEDSNGLAGQPGVGGPDSGSYGGDETTSRYPNYNRPGEDNNGGDEYNGRYPNYNRPSGENNGGDEYNGRYPNYNRPGGDSNGLAGQSGVGGPDGGSYGGDETTSRYPNYNRPGGDSNGGDEYNGRYPNYNRPGGENNGGDESNGRYPNYNRPGEDSNGLAGQPGTDGGNYGDGDTNDRYPNYGGSNGGTPSGRYPENGGGDNKGPATIQLKTYPSSQTIRFAIFGGDVVFRCRDEGLLRAPVRWVKEGGRPIRATYVDKNGRLELYNVTPADSGIYICQATAYLGQPGSEARVELEVDVKAPVVPQRVTCQRHEATCANGQCIAKSSVCNGIPDCSDRSDEDNCFSGGKCDPNHFKCANNKCIVKTWLCDSDDDCGDGSDESDCGASIPGQCKPTEFACTSNNQCVPKSFQCDSFNDCLDVSDEVGCSLPLTITSPPKPSNVLLNSGDTLVLNCSANGIPQPLISWRRNWGHVPDVCVMEQVNMGGQVVGTLTCRDMQPEYNGAYSCEVMNTRGVEFAVPDAIVFVNRTNICPRGYFNSEARTERECIKCFCFGESSECHSADLFTFDMPTPLGSGGTRLVGIANPENGNVDQSSESINDQYYYQSLRNGATVSKLHVRYDPTWLLSKTVPYLTLPDSYNGNQLTSYGGYIRYRLGPHSDINIQDTSAPDIIIKGTYKNLLHFNRGRQSHVEARLTPEFWRVPSSRGLVPASREDIMMALDNIEMVLLRGSINNAGVNITEFIMQSAQSFDVGQGGASLVEECTCPPGYDGLSCQKCASGYSRYDNGPWLGDCRQTQPECPPGTYGDPNSGYACLPCPCPLTNRENQFARTCGIGPRGNVVCDCARGYEGENCDRCAEGYTGNPLVIGDSCKPTPTTRCDPTGTANVRLYDECVCKDNVQGRYCNECKPGSFYLSEDFGQGCALCFCSGVSQNCSSGSLRRKTISVTFNTPALVDQVRVYGSTAIDGSRQARYHTPVETNLTATLVRGEVTLRNLDRSRPAIYYWSLPLSFAGDKVTSYGGSLRYSLNHVPGAYADKNTAADVQLISEHHLTFHYFGNFRPTADDTLEASVPFLEKGWHRPDGKEVSRETFLLALADVKAILVKATYSSNFDIASLVSASIDTAEVGGNGPTAMHVEVCECSEEYVGTSCEDCSPGYTRYESGVYLKKCGPCRCNGHSKMCDGETGVCSDCRDNTMGDFCELCIPGYNRDSNDNCVPDSNPPPTRCDPRGTEEDYGIGYCSCKSNVEGENCDVCRPGTFGLRAENPLGCSSCFCSGITSDCHEASRYVKIPLPAPMLGDNYGGYSLTNLRADRVLHDHIISMPTNSELMYVFDSSAPIEEELYWSLPVLPGNRVLSYGGNIQLKQHFQSSNSENEVSEPGTDVILVSDEKSLYWSNPQAIVSGQPLTYQVPLREDAWFLLNSRTPASRSDLLSVLSKLRRVLVRATLTDRIASSSIADVSMDIANKLLDSSFPEAKDIEECNCPEGYLGTSCESCAGGYYMDQYSRCVRCACNGHDCHLDTNNQLVCDCRPPYTGYDCSLRGEPNRYPQANATTRPPPPYSTVVVRITSPTLKIQEVGSSVTFTCQAQSTMTHRNLPIDWYKRDGQLPQGRTLIDNNQGKLTITNVQVSDSGAYICRTIDGFSTAEDYATLKVPINAMTLPNVVIQPAGLKEYYEGALVELNCTATGNPHPTISWRRSGNRPLPLSALVIGSQLVITQVRMEDSGEYICVATNQLGPANNKVIVNVQHRPSAPQRERLSVSPTAVTVNEGASTRVTCTGSANVPPNSIDWIRQDGAELPSNVRSQNGVLYISYATVENQGSYLCQTSSEFAEPVLVVVMVNSQSTRPPEQQPNITVSVQSLTIPTGGSNSIECSPTGYPLPLIRWTKNDAEFGPGVSQQRNQLVITNARDEDGGYYACEGSVDGNLIERIYVYVNIEKLEAPQVAIWPQDEQIVTLGSTFELRCTVLAGIPEPAVVWSRQRALGSHVTMLPQNILRFDQIEVNDEGTYTCSATNNAGTATANTVVRVQSLPEITITPSDYIYAVYGEAVKVECRASGYPLPYVSIKTSDNIEIVPPTPGMAVLNIMSASDRDDGSRYLCSASSSGGTITEEFGISVSRGDGGFDGVEGSGEIDIGPRLPDPYPVYPDSRPEDLLAIQGQDSVITCDAPDQYQVEWTRADGQLQPNARQNNNQLIIRNATKSDSGQYVCNFYDRYTHTLQRSAYTSLLVIAAPRITLRPQSQTVRPGESPIVECVVEGDEIQEVSWQPVSRPFSGRVEARERVLIFHNIEVQDAGTYVCFAKNRVANASADAEVIVSGPPFEPRRLVQIIQPRRPFRVGENVEVDCQGTSDVRVSWERVGTNQFLPQRTYGGGSMLSLQSVQESDAGQYRCNGITPYGNSSDIFDLEVQPGYVPARPDNENEVGPQYEQYTAQLGENIDIPCNHNVEEPERIEWRREHKVLSPQVNPNEQNLHLERVSESDVGTYICRVTSRRQRPVETRAILKVSGVVPRFDGDSWISLPTLKDAYKQFDIEISFKPQDDNGLIFYNGDIRESPGEYIALRLISGVPEFIFNLGVGAESIKGDRPLELNAWHTIRISKTSSKVSMDVDNNGPTSVASSWELLELEGPLYIGGVRSYIDLPETLAGTSGFVGCISMLILGREEKNIVVDYSDRYNVGNCNSCTPNYCYKNGVCQEARNERGYLCICTAGYAGQNCDRTGEACRPGLCGPGKCYDTVDGYKCACPVTFTGKNCELKRSIEYPAFAGSAYLAIAAPSPSRFFRMSMKIKPTAPVMDGIIMYCAESPRGYGGFTALTVREGRLELIYDLGDETRPVRLTSERPLRANEWTDVNIMRAGLEVSLRINTHYNIDQNLEGNHDLSLKTPMFVGGVDDSIVLNKNLLVSGGFSGCIKNVTNYGNNVDIVGSSIESANVQECSNYDRGDIPEAENICSQCSNGAACSADGLGCVCPAGYEGPYCERRVPLRPIRVAQPCDSQPCMNGGSCRTDYIARTNYSCDCPLRFTGSKCQFPLQLLNSVGFSGNGHVELPANLLRYDNLESSPASIAMALYTLYDGVLLFQNQLKYPVNGDYIMLRVVNGVVELEYDMGSGKTIVSVPSVVVNDGERHQIIVMLRNDGSASLSVDNVSEIKQSDDQSFASVFDADSNIFIGGIPDYLNINRYSGLEGCIEQVEFTDMNRGVSLGTTAVSGKNAQQCRDVLDREII